MTEQVKAKRGRKPKAVTTPVEPKIEAVVEKETPEIVPETTSESVDLKSEIDLDTKEGEVVDTALVTPVTDLEGVVVSSEGDGIIEPVKTADEAPSEPVDLDETEDLTKEPVDEVLEPAVVPDSFKPILRPTSVKGEPVGHLPVPRAIFDLVTKDENWRSKIDTNSAKHGLMSVAYWVDRNGSVKARCMSSSKFGDVL